LEYNELGKNEVLDDLASRATSEIVPLINKLEFEKKIFDGELYVSGPYDPDIVETAKSLLKKYKYFDWIVEPCFKKYNFESKYTGLGGEKQKYIKICHEIIQKYGK
jgi:hypothetical protein